MLRMLLFNSLVCWLDGVVINIGLSLFLIFCGSGLDGRCGRRRRKGRGHLLGDLPSALFLSWAWIRRTMEGGGRRTWKIFFV